MHTHILASATCVRVRCFKLETRSAQKFHRFLSFVYFGRVHAKGTKSVIWYVKRNKWDAKTESTKTIAMNINFAELLLSIWYINDDKNDFTTSCRCDAAGRQQTANNKWILAAVGPMGSLASSDCQACPIATCRLASDRISNWNWNIFTLACTVCKCLQWHTHTHAQLSWHATEHRCALCSYRQTPSGVEVRYQIWYSAASKRMIEGAGWHSNSALLFWWAVQRHHLRTHRQRVQSAGTGWTSERQQISTIKIRLGQCWQGVQQTQFVGMCVWCLVPKAPLVMLLLIKCVSFDLRCHQLPAILQLHQSRCKIPHNKEINTGYQPAIRMWKLRRNRKGWIGSPALTVVTSARGARAP